MIQLTGKPLIILNNMTNYLFKGMFASLLYLFVRHVCPLFDSNVYHYFCLKTHVHYVSILNDKNCGGALADLCLCVGDLVGIVPKL